jgi:sugar/nucleoside kinase (ribokinase family)
MLQWNTYYDDSDPENKRWRWRAKPVDVVTPSELEAVRIEDLPPDLQTAVRELYDVGNVDGFHGGVRITHLPVKRGESLFVQVEGSAEMTIFIQVSEEGECTLYGPVNTPAL